MRKNKRRGQYGTHTLKKTNIWIRFGGAFCRFCKKAGGKYFLSFVSCLTAEVMVIAFLLYGPVEYFRELLITSAMTTFSHQYYATTFYSQATIDQVMSKNTVTDLDTTTDADSIQTKNHNEAIKVKKISGSGYNGLVMEISDPAWVQLGIPKNFGTKGQKIPKLIEDYGAIAGINAGGFGDANGYGNGGTAVGMVMVDGVMLKKPATKSVNIIGFNNNNVLVLGKYNVSQLDSLNLRCACEFTPFLIINGVPADISGNGGWGVAPRTAIGQRQDGTVLFVVIDGRSIASAGATIKQLQQVLIDEKAYNAANLDGGSSTVLYYTEEGGVMNNPSGSDSDGMRFLPNAWLVIDPETYHAPADRPPYV